MLQNNTHNARAQTFPQAESPSRGMTSPWRGAVAHQVACLPAIVASIRSRRSNTLPAGHATSTECEIYPPRYPCAFLLTKLSIHTLIHLKSPINSFARTIQEAGGYVPPRGKSLSRDRIGPWR
eukprot:1618870-Pleurochrysis_carterae.AAC.1